MVLDDVANHYEFGRYRSKIPDATATISPEDQQDNTRMALPKLLEVAAMLAGVTRQIVTRGT